MDQKGSTAPEPQKGLKHLAISSLHSSVVYGCYSVCHRVQTQDHSVCFACVFLLLAELADPSVSGLFLLQLKEIHLRIILINLSCSVASQSLIARSSNSLPLSELFLVLMYLCSCIQNCWFLTLCSSPEQPDWPPASTRLCSSPIG